ncbi:MAG: hypothetical protein ACK5LP_06375 [Campylobacteraceae bacterium]
MGKQRMIEGLSLREHLGFESANVNFENGLVVFTGASGSGKSVFFSALLSVFGLASTDASMIESSVDNKLNLDEFGIENDEVNIFKCIKQKSMRYFINGGQIPQKSVKQISQSFISYLSIRDTNEFDNVSLIELIDLFLAKKDTLHVKKIEEFNELFLKYSEVKSSLLKLEEEERKIGELKEFATFEISKIEKISPKVGEDEELLEFKKMLSKKEKISSTISEAEEIFNFENAVNSALDLIGKKSDIFDEAMNHLREIFEVQKDKLNELEDVDIESILDRIEQISALKNRYGSVEETLEYLKKKKEELAHYENITFEKKELQKSFEELSVKIKKLLDEISKKRKEAIKPLENIINGYLKELFLENMSLHVKSCELNKLGDLEFSISLNNTEIKKISSGEYNRLRLGMIATKNELKSVKNGILILDEVDSNLSGKESMSVANILKKISKDYQIFAISHHPQLSSCAKQHFNIYRVGDKSFIKELNEDERIEELARMISGKDINEQAREFAKELRRTNR